MLEFFREIIKSEWFQKNEKIPDQKIYTIWCYIKKDIRIPFFKKLSKKIDIPVNMLRGQEKDLMFKKGWSNE